MWCDVKEVWSFDLDGESSITMGGVNADGGDDWTTDVETDLDSELIGGSNGAKVDWCLCSTVGVGSTMFRQIVLVVEALMVFSLSSALLLLWRKSLNCSSLDLGVETTLVGISEELDESSVRSKKGTSFSTAGSVISATCVVVLDPRWSSETVAR